MRKAIFFTLLLLLQTAVMGQTGHQLRYWFDGDHDKLQTMQVATGESQQLIDVTHLATGFHRIYIQTMDSSRVLGLPVVHEFYKAAPESMDAVYFYWFDGNHNETKKVQVPIGRWRQPIDVQQLSTGFHEIFMQVADGSGTYSSPVSHSFYKCIADNEETKYSCWFDEDSTTTIRGKCNNGIIWLDVNELSDGFHLLNMQVHNQASSQPVERAFIKVPQTENVDYLTCMLMVDDTLFHEERIASTRGVLNFDFDVSSLSQGPHLLQAFVVTPTGAATNIEERFFIRAVTDTEIAGLKCYYVVDDAKDSVQAGTYSNGVFHFDIDVSSLEDGLHNLNYMLIGDNGVTTEMRTAFFTKIPVGGNGITEYHYWLNEDDSIKVVKRLEKRMNPLQITSLLPVESVPLRSKLFHFEVKDSAPMIFAKNIFNMRFFDASGRMTDCSREYIDYNVSQKVEGVTYIARGKDCKTFTAPGKNEIEWMGIEMQTGDTLAIKSNAACAIQIFSPSGKEVYAVSGAESVVFDGIHAWEDGTYYVAVHDVTSSNSDIELSTLHMDEYDVVSQDVTAVGDGGASTITYKGNGLKHLCEVKFINSANDTIKAEYIERISDAEVGVIADFNMAAHGDYDALFIFSGYEYKKVSNSVTVEEATEIKLKTKVNFASSFLRSIGKTTYQVNITNSGNMTSYVVPINIYVASENEGGISKISIEGLNLPKVFAGVDRDSVPVEDREWLAALEEKIGENHYFLSSKVLDESTGDSVYAKAGLFYADIAPNSTKNIVITVEATETVDLWVTTPKDNIPFTNKIEEFDSGMNKINSRSLKEHYCCVREIVECVASLAADGVSIANTVVGLSGAPQAAALGVADCVVSATSTIISSVGTVMCDEGDFEKSFWDKVKNVVNGTSITGMLTSCASKVLPWKNLNKLLEAIGDVSGNTSMIFGLGINHADCIVAFTQKKPNCPPNPSGGGGKSSPVTSFDPNDIVGFAAESGSRFVPSSFEDVHYTIRSENDPVFATAAAHTIIVTDTLDGSKFDLSAFAATSVKIGSVMMELNGEKSFVKTMDLRPAIDVVAEVTLDYDETQGIATWTILSLDPMTMEPTEDPMQGALPVNNGGNGEAEFGFNIKLKSALVDGTEVDNKASIIFDNETAVVTPVWRNIIDNVKPTSAIAAIETINDSVIEVSWEGKDVGSGMWKYDLYVQPGNVDEWIKFPCDTLRTSCRLSYVDNLSMGFCVVAIDSAGNVEDKKLTREAVFMRGTKRGDANMDSIVSLDDVITTVKHILGNSSHIFNITAADVNQDRQITISDVVGIVNIILNPDDYIVKYVKRRNGVALATEYLSIEDIIRNDDDSLTLPIELFNDNDCTAFQMDFEIPDGLNVVSISLGDRATESHSVTWERLSDGKMRVVAYSTDNALLGGNAGNILNLNLVAEKNVNGKLSISNIRLASPDGNETLLEDCCSLLDISGVTGIGRTVDDALRVYTVDGVLAIECSKPMQMAVYSVNGTLFKMLSLVEGKNICNTIPAGTYIVSGVTVIVNPQSE